MKSIITDNQPRFLVLALMVLSAAFVRFLSLPLDNVNPFAAMALFGAVHFRNKSVGLILPLIALFITDLIIGFHSTMIFVYGSFLLVGLIGLTVQNRVKPVPLMLASVTSSVVFFLITNFGAWLTGTFYPKTFEGLMACYTAGLPFFRGTLAGDLLFVGVMFGGFALLRQRFPVLARA